MDVQQMQAQLAALQQQLNQTNVNDNYNPGQMYDTNNNNNNNNLSQTQNNTNQGNTTPVNNDLNADMTRLAQLQNQLNNVTTKPKVEPTPNPSNTDWSGFLNELGGNKNSPTSTSLDQDQSRLDQLQAQLNTTTNQPKQSTSLDQDQTRLAQLQAQLNNSTTIPTSSSLDQDQTRLAQLQAQLNNSTTTPTSSSLDQDQTRLAQLQAQLNSSTTSTPSSSNLAQSNPTSNFLSQLQNGTTANNANTDKLAQLQNKLQTLQSASNVEVKQGSRINTYKPAQPQIKSDARVCGYVTRIVDGPYRSNDKTFYLRSTTTNQEYQCKSNFFFPINENDIVDGMVRIENNGFNNKNKTLHFIKDYIPFVEMSYEKDAIIQVWIKILRNTSFGAIKAGRLFNLLTKLLNNQPNMVAVYLSEISIAYAKNKDKKYIDVLTTNSILTEKQADTLLEQWYRKRDLRRLYLCGLTNKDIREINMAPDILYKQLHEDPMVVYQLKHEKAIIIAKQHNIDLSNSQLRSGEIVRFMYDKLTNNSWTCTPLNKMYRAFPDFLQYKDLLIEKYQIILDEDAAYLRYPYTVETELAMDFAKMLSRPDNYKMADPHFKRDTLSEDQKAAIKGALQSPLSMITGAAGTGKTTIIDELVHNMDLQELDYLIVSFTGKAVARVKEVVSTLEKEKATTINLTLTKGYHGNKSPTYIIVDEASMVRSKLMYDLGVVFGFNFQLILVGDVNQLQPIGWGAFFHQMIYSKACPIYELTVNHRSMLRNNIINGIIYNAQALIEYIDQKDYDDVQGFELYQTDNFQLIDGNIDVVYNVVRGLRNNGVEPNKITIICPYRRYLLELNSTCQQIFNDGHDSVESGGITWMVGDRVMMRENNYDIYVMNGEEGRVVETNPTSIKVRFNNGVEHYFLLVGDNEVLDPYGNNDKEDEDPFNPAGNKLTVKFLCHSFALTVHRSQGSEWEYIIFYIPHVNNEQMSSFIDYRLIYTGITRARKFVWCVGDMISLNQSCSNKGRYRHDNLGKRVLEYRKELPQSTFNGILPGNDKSTMFDHPKYAVHPAGPMPDDIHPGR